MFLGAVAMHLAHNAKSGWDISPKSAFFKNFTYTPIPPGQIRNIISGGWNSSQYGTIQQWNTSLITDMSGLFADNANFNDDISNWDTSKVTDMSGMFSGASIFNKSLATNGSSWNVEKVTTMSNMFRDASGFNQDISSWNVSAVINMTGMFKNSVGFNKDLTDWILNTAQVPSLIDMFKGATNLSGQWSTHPSFNDTPSPPFFSTIENITQNNIHGAVDLWASNNIMALKNYGHISYWNTNPVTDMGGLFTSKNNFNDDISSWDTRNVMDMSGMFNGASIFNQNIATDGSGWNVEKVTTMNNMFKNANIFNGNITNWNVSKVSYMAGMFEGAAAFDQPISTTNTYWDVTKVRNMTGMFKGASIFNQNIANWTVVNVSNMSDMFNGASTFNQDISIWDISTNVTDMSNMFRDASGFNQDITNWVLNTASVPILTNMFEGATAMHAKFNSYLGWGTSPLSYFFSFNPTPIPQGDIKSEVISLINGNSTKYGPVSNWDTTLITDMSGLFANKQSFNYDISNWNTSSVTTMENMFSGASIFNKSLATNGSGWNVEKVTTMSNMFRDASGFNQDISSWNVSAVINMTGMFKNSVGFNKDLTDWILNTSPSPSLIDMFTGATSMSGYWSAHPSFDSTPSPPFFSTIENITQDNIHGAVDLWASNNSTMALKNYGNISSWNTSPVTDMSGLFANKNNFNEDISNWNTSFVTDMSGMFNYALNF